MRTLLLFLLLSATAGAQTINPSAITVTLPSGTAASPFFVIDSDTGVAPLTRNTIPVTVTVTLPRISTGTTGVFRVSGDLLPASSTVPMKVLSSTRLSATQSINLNGTGTITRTFTLNLKPSEDLGAGATYRVRAQLQAETSPKVFTDLGSAVIRGSFTVVHFRDSTPSTNLNLHAHLAAPATLSRAFALISSAAQDDFQVRVPLLFTRYDLGDIARNVSFRTTITLLDDLGTKIDLVNGGQRTRHCPPLRSEPSPTAARTLRR